MGRDSERSYSPKTKRAHGRPSESEGSRRAKASLAYSSPEGRAFGQSPSHRDRLQRGSPADRRNWRERQRDGQKHDKLGKHTDSLPPNERVGLKTEAYICLHLVCVSGSVQSWREKSRIVRIESCLTKKDVLLLCSEAEGTDWDLKEVCKE